jgi:type VI secretion system protein ImpH
MGAELGRETDTVTFLSALADAPHRYDFYQTLRRLECLYGEKPRWGAALRPADEPVRLGQDADLAFAPAPLAAFERPAGAPPRLQVRLFGLLGPNGPLPLHLTEYARDRVRHAGDATFSRFLDMLHHRFLAMFYRAWAQAQPHVNRDRPAQDRFAVYLGALAGIAPPAFRERDTVPDLAKLFHAGTLVRQVRNAEGLGGILEHYFRVPVQIGEFTGHWMPLGDGELTRLGAGTTALGHSTVLGRQVWDRQHKFRIRLGPLTLAEYERFLPGGPLLQKLVDWVRMYLCFELDWDVQLRLQPREVPRLTLGGGRRLGWTTWLGTRSAPTDAADLCLDAERFVAGAGEAAA